MNQTELNGDWIFSNVAAELLLAAQQQLTLGTQPLTILNRLRKSISPSQARAIVDLASLRIRAKHKFAKAEKMFFTRQGLEMASSEKIAQHKADRFKPFASTVDFCCGIGGDLIAMSQITQCTGFDSDPFAVACANCNLTANNLPQNAILNSYASDLAKQFEAIHIDPERRTLGRSTSGEAFSPKLSELLGIANEQSVGIKVAPATRISESDNPQLELCWIGHRRECKQQMIWSGKLATHPGCRSAVSLDATEDNCFSCSFDEAQNSTPQSAPKLGRFIYEPHNCVLAARLEDALASQYCLRKPTKNIAYFTSDQQIQHGLLSRFETLEVLPANIQKTQSAIDSYYFSDLEIKKRGVAHSFVNKFPLKNNKKGSQRGTVLFTMINEKPIVIIARRDTLQR